MDVSTGIGNASRIRMLADGLHDAGAAWNHRVHMEVWPILNARQVERMGPDVRAYLRDITAAVDQVTPGGGYDEAIAGVRELQSFASSDASRNRRNLRELGAMSIRTAHELDAAVATAPDDVASLAAARSELFGRLRDDAADLTAAEAKALLRFLPPAIAGRQAQAYLGLSSPEHASEFVRTVHKVASGQATTADRERLALIELIGRGTPEADERLRSIALRIFETDPKELSAPAWKRLETMLDIDSSGRVLDGPRALGGSARTLQDASNRIAQKVQLVGKAQTGAVTRRYFEQWREAIRSHVGVDGQPVRPDRRSPNVERMFQLKPPEARQLVADLGRVGASSFDDIRTALAYVDERLELVLDGAPELAKKIDETRALVKDNQLRLAGRLEDGYSTHPEYAELGRIRTNVELVETLVASKAKAAEAAAHAKAAPTAPVDGAGTERLTW